MNSTSGPPPVAPPQFPGASQAADPLRPADPMTAKAALRRRMLNSRRTRAAGSAGVGGDTATEISRRALALPELADARCVAAYVGLAGEPDTSVLLAALRDRGVRILLPVLRPDLDLDFREYSGVLVPGALGTAEPPPAGPLVDLVTVDAVVVPALAVDRAGQRLGRGGGSYDRALARLSSQVPVVAVVDDSELVEDVPVEPHDRPVTIVVTPRRTVRCATAAGT